MKREINVGRRCTRYLLTQWAAVTATWGWMSEAPHLKGLPCVSSPSISSSLSRASIHGNSPNCVNLSSVNTRTHVGFRLPPLTPHEPGGGDCVGPGGGDSVGPGDGGSLEGLTSPTRTTQHTCTPGHCLSVFILSSISASILCTHNIMSVRSLADAMVWSRYRGRGRGEFRPRQTRQLPRAVDLKGRLLSCQSY